MYQTAVNRCASGDYSIRRQFFSCHAEVGGAMLCKDTYLLETFLVDELSHAFPRREFARFMLLLQALFAATLLELRAFLAKLIDSLAHGRARRFKCCRHLCLPGSLS